MKTMSESLTDTELVNANFELEQNIMKCWNFVDDVRDVLRDLDNGHMSEHDATQALHAFADVYQLRFERTFRGYETVCRGLHELRHAVKDFETAQNAGPKPSKTGKSKKQKPVDTKTV